MGRPRGFLPLSSLPEPQPGGTHQGDGSGFPLPAPAPPSALQSPVTQRKLEQWRRLRPLRKEDETSRKRSPRPPPGRQRSRSALDQGGRPGAGTSRPARAPTRRPAGATRPPGPRAHSAAAGLLRAVLDALGFGGSPPPRAPWAAGTAESGAPGPGVLRPRLGIGLLEPGAASLRVLGIRTQVQRIGPRPGAAWPRVAREPPEARAAGPRPRSPVPSRTPLRPSERTAGSWSGGLKAPEKLRSSGKINALGQWF
ncbi:fibroblast growth factor 9 isoform X1 [Bubalus bubalis]|uniref:fibroblast growth factor 9 isoform X1 n=1 Tax=Bubalus bubalis TaxID=89462 RepID=UPI001D129FED|nr:fibroblast growth factor 9 isoform X1 [Bubalus bubalis]